MSQSEIVVSTDGSALGNPNGPMGWAWADHQGGDADAGGATNGTNQIGELCAVLQALRAHRGAAPLTIQTDSQYAINCSTKWVHNWKKKGWKNSAGKPVKNRELIEAIDSEINHRQGPVKFIWIKGHAGDRFNEKVDNLARGYAEDVRKGDRSSYLPIEGWKSLLASPYTKGLKISEEVRLQLKDEPQDLLETPADKKNNKSEKPEKNHKQSEDTQDDNNGIPRTSLLPVNQTKARKDLSDDEIGDTRVLSPLPTKAIEETQKIKLTLEATAQTDDDEQEEPGRTRAMPLPKMPGTIPVKGKATDKGTSNKDTSSKSSGLVARGSLTITPPPARSPYFAGKDLHISGTISFEADIDQNGRVHIDNVPFRLHSIDLRQADDSASSKKKKTSPRIIARIIESNGK